MNTYKKLSEEIKSALVEHLQSKEVQEFIEKTKAATDGGSFEVVVSTADIDRQGETIDQGGWNFDLYRQNPIVLWAHDYSILPIGITESIETIDGKTIAKGKFAPEGANPFAQQVRRLYDLKIVRATSVGFIAKQMEGNKITNAELLEFSFVPVPANPYALSLAKAQELGFDTAMLSLKGIEFKEEEKDDEPKTKPTICEPNSPDYDPEACAAIFCDPNSPQYNPEYCALMKPKQANQEEKSGRILSKHNRDLISLAIEQLKTISVALSELLNAAESQGAEGEERSEDGSALKQRSKDAGSDLGKSLDDWLFFRSVLRSVNNATSDALKIFNERNRRK